LINFFKDLGLISPNFLYLKNEKKCSQNKCNNNLIFEILEFNKITLINLILKNRMGDSFINSNNCTTRL